MKKLFASLAILLAGCASAPAIVTPAPAVVVDTACTTFQIIKVPAEDLPKINDMLKARILSHDRAWVAACRKG